MLAQCGVAQSGRTYEIVDVQAVRAVGDPNAWVVRVPASEQREELDCEALVAGAGMGGLAATLVLAGRGHSVCLTEPTDWIGGQMTAGGVSALDENRFIELAGGTRTYYRMRKAIRDSYRQRYTLAPSVAGLADFNPGSCYVSPLCFEPAVGVRVLRAMLEPFGPRVRLLLRTEIVDLEVRSNRILSALAYNFDTRKTLRIRPRFVLDATELGDLLPLARTPYLVGSEAKAETGEPHAPEAANRACVQSFTYPFAIDYRPNESHRIPRPPQYEHFRDTQPFAFRLYYPVELGWRGYFQYKMFGDDPPIPNNMSPGPFFGWRRLLRKSNFTGPNAPEDLALINWPRQDYQAESILDRTPADLARVLQQAKRVSLAFLYWLQTEVPRDDGASGGYPELRLRPEVMGTPDGLSKYPYVRESRRIKSRVTVREQDIVDQYQKGSRARWFADSVGTAYYMVDIHPCGANERGRMMMPRPFQIPMGTLVPLAPENLLAAGKNIGVTHLTNGAFRLHPVEWNVGEAAGVMASTALETGRLPEFWTVQKELANLGVPLVWFDDLTVNHAAFASIQLTALRGIYPLSDDDLHAAPDAPVTRAEAAQALAALFETQAIGDGRPGFTPEAAVMLAVEKGWMAVDHRNWFHPDLPFYWADWREQRFPRPLAPLRPARRGPVRRSELAERLSASLTP